jgi:tetratricopeptide (TPR) repeat protein
MVALVFPAAAVPFATVHPGVRETMALAALAAGLAAMWPYGRRLGAVGALALAAWLATAVTLFPVGPAVRETLQPGLAPLVASGLEAGGRSWHDLALDPKRAWTAFALGGGALAVGLAAMHGSRRGARASAGVLGVSAAAITGWAWIQWITGAKSIGWFSGVGSPPEGSFGPFVDPNHAGAALAAILPLALARAWREGGVWLFLSATIAAGAVSTGSRGAAAAAAVGVTAQLLMSGAPKVRAGLSLLLATAAVGLLAYGPRQGLSGIDDTDRLEIWGDSLTLIGWAPLVGVGAGGFASAWPAVKTTPNFARVAHAHQEPLQVLIEHGLPVTLLLVAATIAGAVQVTRALRDSGDERRLWLAAYGGGAAALLVASCVDFPLRIGAVLFLAAVILGTLVGLANGVRPAASRAPLAVIAAATLFGAISAFGSVDADRARNAADEAWAAGDAAASEAAARKALGARPVDGDAWMRLARALGGQDRDEEAMAALVHATEADPTLPWPWLAIARARRGDPASGEAWARLLALDAPGGGIPEAWIREAMADSNDPVTAALERIPRMERLCHAAAMMSGRDPEASEMLFAVAVPAHPPCVAERAIRLVHWGRPHEALGLADQVPDPCDAHRVRGAALARLERWPDALSELDAALRCGPKDPYVRYGLARARLATGDRSGLGILEGLVAEDPSFADARRALWRELSSRGRLDEALPHLKQLVEGGQATADEKAMFERLGN